MTGIALSTGLNPFDDVAWYTRWFTSFKRAEKRYIRNTWPLVANFETRNAKNIAFTKSIPAGGGTAGAPTVARVNIKVNRLEYDPEAAKDDVLIMQGAIHAIQRFRKPSAHIGAFVVGLFHKSPPKVELLNVGTDPKFDYKMAIALTKLGAVVTNFTIQDPDPATSLTLAAVQAQMQSIHNAIAAAREATKSSASRPMISTAAAQRVPAFG
jgi:hypothetical protein